ncbi:MAG: DNA-processing protein DprA [Patescibacteria group bacterium]
MSDNKHEKDRELKYWLALAQIKKIGPVSFKKIIDYFALGENAWRANLADLLTAGLDKKLAEEVVVERSQINPDAVWEKVSQSGVGFIFIQDKNYPQLLKEIYNPPALLFFRGSPEAINNFCLAVVGTRKYSPYGQQATEEIAGQLAREHLTIVSGLALGIDALAHEAALKNNGLTVAVLGAAVEEKSIYPAENRRLAERIVASGGALISEYPPGTQPAKFTFPMRNRIISGLSRGVVVVEAPENSGALITAKYALEQNREVFAIPGSIYSNNSQGTNNLIKLGAKMVTRADDVLEELNLQQVARFMENKKILPANSEEELILKALSKEPTHVDKIAKISKLKINVLSGLLTLMEMKGSIKDLGGKNYILR